MRQEKCWALSLIFAAVRKRQIMFLSRTNHSQGANKEAAPFERLLQYKGKIENYLLRVIATVALGSTRVLLAMKLEIH
jgi:hypothetical protein